MTTPFDWITMAVFAAIVVLFLQRSAASVQQDTMLHYLPPALGCAVANYLGNHDQPWPAALILGLVAGYMLVVLKPFRRN
jgi:hypothetical protein